jgi:hypothetical protein
MTNLPPTPPKATVKPRKLLTGLKQTTSTNDSSYQYFSQSIKNWRNFAVSTAHDLLQKPNMVLLLTEKIF